MQEQLQTDNEHILYEDDSITITDTKVKFKGESIYLKNVVGTKILTKRKRIIVGHSILGVGFLMVLIGLLTENFFLVYFSSPIIGFSVTWYLWFTYKVYTLVLSTNTEQIDTVTSRKLDHIEMLQATLKIDEKPENKIFYKPKEIKIDLTFTDYAFMVIFVFCSCYAIYSLILS